MKKIICHVLIMLVLLSCLTSCNFTQKASGALAGKAEATPKTEEMMTALAENRTSDAKALLHPKASESSDNAIAQMNSYLAGRETKSIELQSINVNSSAGTSGKTREEQVTYRVTLNDDTVISVNAVYLSDNQGSGFSSFQLVLGVA